MKYKNLIAIIIVIWFTLVASSFLWNLSDRKKEQKHIALQSAKSIFNYIIITRLWNARYGGVYVNVTKGTKPNPYLDDPMRDIRINDNLTLTKINPAYMTRQISEIAQKKDGVHFHITSLKPIRPQNKPTKKEKEFLEAFEKGEKEKSMFFEKNNKKYFFYMAPLITKKPCLKCHAKQGYKVGDVRGGISVTLPFVMNIQIVPLLFGHFLIFISGLLGLIILGGELNEAYDKIKKQAVIDALTGVPNRRNFMETLFKEFNRSIRSQKPLSVIMCDIDNFKIFNDTYGHKEGDKCLKKVAQAVQSTLKRASDFCARYGGEEFIVILPNTEIEGAMYIAEKIRTNVEKLKIPNEKSLPYKIVTLSLGVASTKGFDSTSENKEELIKQADIALYKAKNSGRNQVKVYDKD